MHSKFVIFFHLSNLQRFNTSAEAGGYNLFSNLWVILGISGSIGVLVLLVILFVKSSSSEETKEFNQGFGEMFSASLASKLDTSETESSFQVLLSFWRWIVNWANDSLLLWIKKNLVPSLWQTTTDALIQIDKLNSSARRLVKNAWKKLRKFLAESIITFQRKVFPDEKVQWMRHWSTKIYNVTNSSKPTVKIIVTEESIEFDDLPQYVRLAYLRNDNDEIQLDFLDVRDKEMEMVA